MGERRREEEGVEGEGGGQMFDLPFFSKRKGERERKWKEERKVGKGREGEG